MPVIDAERGRAVARQLIRAFQTTGIHGKRSMPADLIPRSVTRGSLEHILFLTLTVSIDYMREANALWTSARRTFENEETRHLFSAADIAGTPLERIIRGLQKYRLSKKPDKDALIWKTIGETLHSKWQGDPRNFLRACQWNAEIILSRLRTETHMQGGRIIDDFPYLRGSKIGPLWLRILKDNGGLAKLHNLGRVPIPVDVHIARATFATGVVSGQYQGTMHEIAGYIRQAWCDSVRELTLSDRPVIALDVDEPLWHLSKYGCTKRAHSGRKCPRLESCMARDYCVHGAIIIRDGNVTLGTHI